MQEGTLFPKTNDDDTFFFGWLHDMPVWINIWWVGIDPLYSSPDLSRPLQASRDLGVRGQSWNAEFSLAEGISESLHDENCVNAWDVAKVYRPALIFEKPVLPLLEHFSVLIDFKVDGVKINDFMSCRKVNYKF